MIHIEKMLSLDWPPVDTVNTAETFPIGVNAVITLCSRDL